MAWHRSNETSKRLDEIPGGAGQPLWFASIADPILGLDRARAEAALERGERLGSISKQGDRYLRSLFTAGALAVIRYAKILGMGAQEQEFGHG